MRTTTVDTDFFFGVPQHKLGPVDMMVVDTSVFQSLAGGLSSRTPLHLFSPPSFLLGPLEEALPVISQNGVKSVCELELTMAAAGL